MQVPNHSSRSSKQQAKILPPCDVSCRLGIKRAAVPADMVQPLAKQAHLADTVAKVVPAILSPRDQLKDYVVTLALHRADVDFHRQRAAVFDDFIYPFIEQHSENDTLIIPQMTGTGKMLRQVIHLAIAFKNSGQEVHKARQDLDQKPRK